MTTSTHIGGFWFHIKWNASGTFGIDHRGNEWRDRSNPQPVDTYIKAVHELAHSLIIGLSPINKR